MSAHNESRRLWIVSACLRLLCLALICAFFQDYDETKDLFWAHEFYFGLATAIPFHALLLLVASCCLVLPLKWIFRGFVSPIFYLLFPLPLCLCIVDELAGLTFGGGFSYMNLLLVGLEIIGVSVMLAAQADARRDRAQILTQLGC